MTKDHRSVALLKLWLRSVNISYTEAGPFDLIAKRANSAESLVHVTVKGSGDTPPGALEVPGGKLTGRSLKEGLAAFDDLQRALGYMPRPPINRGKLPEHKLSNGEDFDLVAFRHTELRRVPNPDPAKLAKYDKIIMRTVWKFYRENSASCKDHMLDINDLKTYALVWTTIFIGLYEGDEAAGSTSNENIRLLYTYLGQRFHDFRDNLMSFQPNRLPALDDAHIGQHGRPYEHGSKLSWESQEPAHDDEEDDLIARRRREWRRGKNYEIDISVAGSSERREAATGVLDRLLGEQSHDDMVTLLKEAAESQRTSPDARAEATKRLRHHAKACTPCQELALAVEVDEDVRGADPASA